MSSCLQRHWQEYTHSTSFSPRLTLEQRAHSWRRATRAEKKEKMLKNMMQASLTYWVAPCVCVYAALRLAKKPARLQLFCFLSRPHTSWAVAFVVWVYEDFYIFFLSPSYCQVLSKGGSTHETAVWLPSNQDVEHFAFHNLSSLKPMKQCSQPGT